MKLRTGLLLFLFLVSAISGWAEDCPRRIGRLPNGPAAAVAVDDQRAYLGSGATVQVLDVSDPSEPQRVGRVEVETMVRRLVVEDDLVYVTAGIDGMTIIDVSDASAPLVVSRIGGPNAPLIRFDDVAAVDRIAFVAASSDGLRVFDIADSEHPVQIGAIEEIGDVNCVAVNSNYAYVAVNYGLLVVDVTDPANPAVVSSTPFDLSWGGDIVAIGSTVYIAGQSGLQVVDVSDPAAPSVTGTFDWSFSTTVDGLDVWGDLAYVTDLNVGVRLIDVSDPTDPLQVALLEPPPYGPGVAAMEGILFWAAGDAGLRAYDVSIPSTPVEIGSFSTPAAVSVVAVDGARGVAVARDSLRVLDMTDPANPIEIGVYHPAGRWDANCVDLVGGFAYVCDHVNDRVVVLDTSEANAVAPVAEINAHGLSDLEVVPPYAFIQGAELLIVDISDPTNPSQVGALSGVGQFIAVELPYLYGTRWTEGLHFPGLNIVDVSDPIHPQIVGSAFHGDIACCSRAAVSNSFVYVLDYPSEGYTLEVVDARDPAIPVVVGSTYFGSMSDVAVFGSSGLLGTNDESGGALLELDLTNPASPTVVGRQDTPYWVGSISMEDRFWYASEGRAGFEVFELCNASLKETIWLEIAAHGSGTNGSEWRTDVVARNFGNSEATLELTLHVDGVEHELTTSVAAEAQAVFEDVVGMMGVEGKGALEVRSTQPLFVLGRIYNENDQGTYGQFLQGSSSLDGLSTGEAAWLHGLRQLGEDYRSNLSVTNTGQEDANVQITLFGTDGVELTTFDLGPIEPGEVVQELAPLATRAGRPDIGWAMAKIEVITGSGILASGSVIDSRSNDPTTIPLVRAGDS
jgi:hypothetical protein